MNTLRRLGPGIRVFSFKASCLLIPFLLVDGARGSSPAEMDEHLTRLRNRWGPAHTVTSLGPFAIVGDEPRPRVIQHRDHTIRWAYQKLSTQFFDAHPLDRIVTIYLFGSADSYARGALEISGNAPSTPYGYYSAPHDALVMNISTGGGTLIHEMVHPMLDRDFPLARPWINEGLGSLFERCSHREGKIVGLVNWRLQGLQTALREGGLVPIEEVMDMDGPTFYGEGAGLHYAEARYFLYWLQEMGKLRTFYRSYRTNAERDPSGIRTLRKLLNVRDMSRIQGAWEDYVRELTP